MKLSGVQVQLSSEDLLSIVNDFLKIDVLSIDNIIIDNNISIEGYFIWKISINFKITINIISIENGIISCRFSECKLSGIGLFRPIRSMALRFVKNKLLEASIELDSYKDTITIDSNQIINTVPFIDLKIQDLYIKKGILNVDLAEINFSLEGNLKKQNTIKIQEKQEEKLVLPLKKVNDTYTKGRSKLEKRFYGKLDAFYDYVLIVPDIVSLIYRLLKDSRVKIKTKIEISAALAYIMFPIDIIPEFIPFIGKIDDLAVIFFALNRIVNEVPINVIGENWAGKDELVVVLKNAIEFISGYTNSQNIEKLCETVVMLSKL